jgi:hypothetical protein
VFFLAFLFVLVADSTPAYKPKETLDVPMAQAKHDNNNGKWSHMHWLWLF